MKKIDDLLNMPINDQLNLPHSELLSEDELKRMYANSNSVKFKNKEVIIRQGTPVSHIMYIKSGYAKIFKEGRNSNFIILRIEKEGNFLGMLSVFGNELHKYSVSSIGDSEVGFVDIGVFKEVLQNNGQYAYKIISALSNYGLFIFDRLMSQSHKQLPGRIADVLLYFSEEIYNSEAFTFPFTRKELAELAGTTKESFIRTLTEFKNDKIIKLDGSDVEIISMDNVKMLSRLG
jgi:CRP/FNR family transcriptional regulator, polysaccharide utilization system transcription regulator